MKKYLCLFLLLVASFSCEKEEATEIVLRIKNTKVNCSGYEGQTECYLVQQGSLIGTEDWEYFYEQIEGFEYSAGYIYELLVKKIEVDDPPTDAPNVKYFLLKRLSKERV